MKINLEIDEVDRIVELLQEQRRNTADGSLSGFGQSIYQEMDDITTLLAKFDDAQGKSLFYERRG